MQVRHAEAVKELEIDAGMVPRLDSSESVVQLKGPVDRDPREVHRGLVGDDERNCREEEKENRPQPGGGT